MARKKVPTQGVKGVETSKLNLSVPTSFQRRLGAYARFHGRTISDLVIEWSTQGMRGFTVHQRSFDGPTETVVTSRAPDGDERPGALKIA